MNIKVSNSYGEQMEMWLPTTDGDIAFRMRKIGIDMIDSKCKLTYADEGALYHCVGKIVDMDELNFFARRMESLSDYEKGIVRVFAYEQKIGNVKGLINLTYSLQGLSLITDFKNRYEVGMQLYKDKHLEITEADMEKVDYEAYAKEILSEKNPLILAEGVLVQNGFKMKEVYNGRTFPEHIYEPNKDVAVLEVQNRTGDKEYLYLPLDWVSLKKTIFRLGVEQLLGCEMTNIRNLRLPQNFIPTLEKVSSTQGLNNFNEMCQAVFEFDNGEMNSLAMAVEFVGTKQMTDITYIARHLDEFGVYPWADNDKEYGEYLVELTGDYKVAESVLPFVDFVALGKHVREKEFNISRYTSQGMVGTNKNIQDFLQYKGEFADPLDLDATNYELFYLYSPLKAELYRESKRVREIYADALVKHAGIITKYLEISLSPIEQMRGIMHYNDQNKELAKKVLFAFPKVVELQGELYGMLECGIASELSQQDVLELKKFWTYQMSDGWGDAFSQVGIKLGEEELYVSFWNNSSKWSVKTAEEMGITQESGLSLSI